MSRALLRYVPPSGRLPQIRSFIAACSHETRVLCHVVMCNLPTAQRSTVYDVCYAAADRGSGPGALDDPIFCMTRLNKP
jgi:hypothetical protein